MWFHLVFGVGVRVSCSTLHLARSTCLNIERRSTLQKTREMASGNDAFIIFLPTRQLRSVPTRVRNWGVRVCEILLISFFLCAWTGEVKRKNNSKFTDPNYPISDSGSYTPSVHAIFLGHRSSCPHLTFMDSVGARKICCPASRQFPRLTC